MSSDNNLSKQTLLLVDDCRQSLAAMTALFSSEYTVVAYDNATEAINYARANDVDLALLDVDMPDMSGHEACKTLKANPATKTIPIIFVTGSGSGRDEEKGLLLGAVDYIIKPVNVAVLRARVRNHMELVYYRKELEVLSSIDGLTGVANRRKLDALLNQHFAAAIRFGYGLALLMIDVDDFKHYNDTYGHARGDQCLREVANTIQSVLRRGTDIVGRYGGEEFTVILPDTDVEGALVFAELLLRSVRALKIKGAGEQTDTAVTISVGVAVLPSSSYARQRTTLSDLIEQADAQLYRAKRMGKNRVCHLE